jgi:DNA processing protein
VPERDALERRLRFTRAIGARGSSALLRLLKGTGGPDRVLALPHDDAARLAGEDAAFLELLLAPLPEKVVEEQALAMERFGARLVLFGEPEYPDLLSEIPDAPPALFFRGLPFPRRPAVAVVGARRASRSGLEAARLVARDLAAMGLVVVSGFARGIDAAAHRAALETGTTAAVFGCGVDVCYPTEGRALLENLLSNGTAISEFPMGTEPRPPYFPIRNRIIAGLSLVTVVVEAAERSGSLVTARLAADYGRDVGAVPGPVVSGSADGSNALLKDGAFLVRSAEDVVRELPEEIRNVLSPRPAKKTRSLSEDAAALLAALSPEDARDADELAAASRLDAPRLSAALVALELEGLVEALPGGRFVKRSA